MGNFKPAILGNSKPTKLGNYDPAFTDIKRADCKGRRQYLIMSRNNILKREYVTGRKDQYDLDYALFRKCVEETETREELIQVLDDRLKYVISKIGSERANDLMEEMGLI